MSWYRAAFLVFLFFTAVLFLFTFTFKGTSEMYTTDLVFLGAILRPQEFSAGDQRLSLGSVADAKDVDMPVDPKRRLLLWARGISIDKPDLFKNVPSTVDERSFRFAGERVELDEPKDLPLRLDNDLPQPAPVKMHLERL